MSDCLVFHVTGTCEDFSVRRTVDNFMNRPAREINTEVVWWLHEMREADPYNHHYFSEYGEHRIIFDRLYISALGKATGSSGAFLFVEDSNGSDSQPGYWRRYVVEGQHLDCTTTYVGMQDRQPPTPSNIELGVN
jgi:hypothetical protein